MVSRAHGHRTSRSPSFSGMPFWGFFLTRGLSSYISQPHIRAILRHVPLAATKKLMNIRDTMERHSKEIIAEKKAALAKGDAALALEVGEGKDIISVLSTSSLSKSRLNMSEPGSSEIPDAS